MTVIRTLYRKWMGSISYRDGDDS